MNLLLTAFAIRRGLALVLTIGAAFFGYHMINQAQTASVNHSIESGQKAYAKSAADAGVNVKGLPKSSAHVKNDGHGTLEVNGAGTKVTVTGLPTTGQ